MRNGTRPEVDTVTIRIPMRLERRGGRKLIITPDGSAPTPAKADCDETMIRALVKAHRWRRQIDTGQFRSGSELAAHEKITDSYVARMLTLTLLAPDITQAIFEGRQPKGLRLANLLRGIPLAWEEQRKRFGFALSSH